MGREQKIMAAKRIEKKREWLQSEEGQKAVAKERERAIHAGAGNIQEKVQRHVSDRVNARLIGPFISKRMESSLDDLIDETRVKDGETEVYGLAVLGLPHVFALAYEIRETAVCVRGTLETVPPVPEMPAQKAPSGDPSRDQREAEQDLAAYSEATANRETVLRGLKLAMASVWAKLDAQCFVFEQIAQATSGDGDQVEPPSSTPAPVEAPHDTEAA